MTEPPVERHDYAAYVLRLWREPSEADNADVWRFSLENVRTGERRGFADLPGLLAFLQGQLTPHDPA